MLKVGKLLTVYYTLLYLTLKLAHGGFSMSLKEPLLERKKNVC